MNIEPGDALAIKINSHRHQWNGQICTNPMQWSCGAPEEFREANCARGKDRCFHQGVFAAGTPKVVLPDRSVVQLFGNNVALLDDQILFFMGSKFDARAGRSPGTWDQTLYGVYRVKRASIETLSTVQNVVIEPYPDGWAVFPRNMVRKPPISPAFDGVAYLNRISRMAARQAIMDALSAAEDNFGSDVLSPSLVERLNRFADSFDDWTETARKNMTTQKAVLARRTSSMSFPSANPMGGALAAQLKEALAAKPIVFPKMVQPEPASEHVHVAVSEEETELETDDKVEETAWMESPDQAALVEDVDIADVSQTAAELPALASVDPVQSFNWRRPPLPEAGQCLEIAAAYGERTVTAIKIATISKSLILLAGAPGVGKSWLATRMIEDERRERSVIIPVSSTWRGREDLLGYTNPINGEFEATAFTRFLRRAELAWKSGDRRPWLGVFEEFNLSQPEHWLSDLLVRLEFEPHRISDRTILLGGSKISGEESGMAAEIYLPPTLVLVGTLNNDHTVRPLSPRVLDRATLIHISATGRAALERVGISSLSPTIEEVVEDLNDVLEPRGVAFSVRAARSLQHAIASLGEEHVLVALDHVIMQEVLSKVRLLAGDPQDGQLVEQLRDWSNREACANLVLCRERIEHWVQVLQSGRDVFQA